MSNLLSWTTVVHVVRYCATGSSTVQRVYPLSTYDSLIDEKRKGKTGTGQSEIRKRPEWGAEMPDRV